MFTIYDALEPYAGRMGTPIKPRDFGKLVQWALDACVAAGCQTFVGRLPLPGIALSANGILFATAGEPTPGTWATHTIAAGDTLADDVFLIANDNAVPFILCARNRGDHYTVIIGIDDVMVDVGCAILAQYNPALYAIRQYRPEAYQKVGAMSVTLAATFTPDLIASWVGLALQHPASERLRELYRGLGAHWLAWQGQPVGQKPRNQNGQLQTLAITTADGHKLEVIGDKTNEQLLWRSHLVAGILAASEQHAPPVAASGTAATLKQVNLDVLMQDLFAEAFGKAQPPAQSDASAPLDSDWLVDDSADLDDSWLADYEDTAQDAPAAAPPTPSATPAVQVPDANVEFLKYINQELNELRDKIMDAGLYRVVSEQPRQVLDAFIQRSGDLMLLLDEMVYLRQMVEGVSAEMDLLDPHELLNALLITYAGEAERRGVALYYAPDDDLPHVKANIEAINRAVFIALEQAIDFAAPRGIVKIGATTRGEMFELTFFSSGAPLTPQAIEALFKPRFLHGADHEGIAHFGFAAVKPIIAAHAGETLIENAEGGNRICIHLPVHSTRSKTI